MTAQSRILSRAMLALGISLAFAACTSGTSGNDDGDAGHDAGHDAGSDAGQDAGHAPDGTGPLDGADAGHDAGGDTDDPRRLIIEQLHLSGIAMGESALVIGPNGTSMLIDVGNDSHADEVREAVDRRLPARRVDWIVLTHYHADHIGGIEDVLAEIEVTGGIVTRGLVDVGDSVGASDFQEMCAALQAPARHIALCDGPATAPCDGDETGMPWPADSCPGLLLGDLADPADDTEGRLAHIDLGGGARIYLTHADGHLALDAGVASAEAEGLSIGHGATDPENARSLGGVIRWGDFAYTFDGDLTGAGDDDVPDLEAFIAARVDEILDAPLPPGALDVAKLSHHGLRSATQQAWVDWLFPADTHDRSAVVGSNHIYFRSPAQSVLDRLGPRLAGGFIWVTELGILPGSHDRMRVADGAVVVEVSDTGASYRVFLWRDGQEHQAASFASTVP